MWRKTRSKVSGSLCVGVDPNRNWDAGFGGEHREGHVLKDGQSLSGQLVILHSSAMLSVC